MLAYAAAAAENNLDHAGRGWGYSSAHAAQWLATVAELGYPLSDIEQQVAADASHQVEEDAVADDAGEAVDD